MLTPIEKTGILRSIAVAQAKWLGNLMAPIERPNKLETHFAQRTIIRRTSNCLPRTVRSRINELVNLTG